LSIQKHIQHPPPYLEHALDGLQGYMLLERGPR